MRRLLSWAIVVAVVGSVALGVGLDAARPSEATDRLAAQSAGPAASGAWYCAVGDSEGDSTMRVLAAVPPDQSGQPSDLEVTTFVEGVEERGSRIQVFPASSFGTDVPDGRTDIGVAVRWWDVPAAISRVWEREITGGISGMIAGPCAAQPSDRWILPGVATAGGAEATLVLANPFATDATLSVAFASGDGLVEPRRLENVVVPKGSVRTVLLNEHAPEQPDLGVIVRTRSGRVVAEAVQTFSAAIGGVEGTSLVRGAPEPALTWTVPWFEVVEGRANSWVWVTNTTDRPAALVATLHTTGGGLVPEGLEELTLRPGEVQRIDLRGLLSPNETNAGVTIRSDNGVPFVASSATEYVGDDPARSGIAIDLAATEPHREWVLPAASTDDARDTLLQLANPTAEQAVVDVTIWTSTGAKRPPELQGAQVGPGGSRQFDLGPHLMPGSDATVFVSAREGMTVAGLRSFAVEGRRDLLSVVGVPGSVWGGGELVAPIDFRPGLTQRVGTSLGPRLSTGSRTTVDGGLDDVPVTPAPMEDPAAGG